MNKKYVFIFLNKESISVYTQTGKSMVLVLKTCPIENIDSYLKLLEDLRDSVFIVFASFENTQIKSFDIKGFKPWHTYDLKQRLHSEYEKHDWMSCWKSGTNLNLIYSNFTENEAKFILLLNERNYKIHSIFSNIQVIDQFILKNSAIKSGGIVTLSLNGNFKHLLYFENELMFTKTHPSPSTNDWIQFMQDKHSITMETLNAEKVIRLHNKPDDTFETFCIQKYKQFKPVKLNRRIDATQNYKLHLLLKQIAFTLGALALLVTIISAPNWIKLHNTTKTRTLIINESDRLNATLKQNLNNQPKHKEIQHYTFAKNFENSKLPFMYVLETIATILPKYGKVLSITLSPSTQTFQETARADTYVLKLLLTPFKSSKHLSLLNTELTQKLGKSLKIHLEKGNLQKSTLSIPSAAVSINIKGVTRELTKDN